MASVKALAEAERFLQRYLDLLAHETPTPEQLVGVLEALGGIDRVVRKAMAEILKSLGWRPDDAGPEPEVMPRRPARTQGLAKTVGGKVIRFPGPRSRRPTS